MTDPPTETPRFHADVDRVRKHYDRLSFLYRMFWGEHLRHGYWNGGETVERAQIRGNYARRRASKEDPASAIDIIPG